MGSIVETYFAVNQSEFLLLAWSVSTNFDRRVPANDVCFPSGEDTAHSR
jgi:hypothetical protein